MIDLHCHILPGVDDGAKDLVEALEMARIAEADGITTIISTSHYVEGSEFVMGQTLRDRVASFNERLHQENIGIKVVLGNEAFISPSLVKDVKDKKVFTMNESRYLLIELPMHDIPMYTEDVLYQLMLEGIIPIIAHPERYVKVIEDPMLLYHLIQKGVLVQINAGSLTGRFGTKVKETCEILLRHNMVHFIGSDGHSPRKRRPEIKEAAKTARQILGEERAMKIIHDNPLKIINHKEIEVEAPIGIEEKQKKLFQNLLKNLLGWVY